MTVEILVGLLFFLTGTAFTLWSIRRVARNGVSSQVDDLKREMQALRDENSALRLTVNTLSRQYGETNRRIDQVEQELQAVSAERDQLRVRNHQLEAMNAALLEQSTLHGRSDAPGSGLLSILGDRLTLDEINALAFELGIDGDELRGDTIGARLTALLAYCRKHRLMPKLLEALRKQRPDIKELPPG